MKHEDRFCLSQEKTPAGDQPKAIKELTKGLKNNEKNQTLLGVTGSGKTFTIANVIEDYQKPTLIIAHNKTLAAQLVQEYREVFPNNEVHYFVSYYDYYQPEAYVPTSDTYIAKEAQINEEINRLRHATTQALLTRKDVIVVASVSAIYGLGSPEEYEEAHMHIQKGMKLSREDLVRNAITRYFERTHGELKPGNIRVIADVVEIMPTNEDCVYRISFEKNKVKLITKLDARTRAIIQDDIDTFFLFPSKHFVSDKSTQKKAISNIKKELEEQVAMLKNQGKELEGERLRRKTLQDISLIEEIGYCNGIENYSRFFDGRKKGEAPNTLISYFQHVMKDKDFLTVIDESHVTIPQISGMYAGDASRKNTLIEHGFRLPSARDNRPLTFEEFEENIGPVIYISATPGAYEKEKSSSIIEQIIRPTGLVDPHIEVHPVTGKDKYPGQVRDFIIEAQKEIKKNGRALVTTLTKKTAEELAEFLSEANIKAEYIHSDVKTIERIEILTKFRKGEFDVLVGVNLLREGLDLPEVSLVAILDSDNEGFLRTETSLIQTIGRAARNKDGRVLLYADTVTGSLERAISETERRRKLQLEYNKKHNITPRTIKKQISDITEQLESRRRKTVEESIAVFDIEEYKKAPKKVIREKEKKMNEAVASLDFETAALIRDRDEITYLESIK